MRLTIELDPHSIQDAINQLNRYKREMERRKDAFIRQLAFIARDTIVERLYSVGYEGAMPYVSDPEPTGNGYRITAGGESICFIEFGAGVGAGAGLLTPNPPVAVTPGSWSQTYGKGIFVPGSHEYWYYNGHKTSGNLPANAFFWAQKAVEEEAPRLAKEIFND